MRGMPWEFDGRRGRTAGVIVTDECTGETLAQADDLDAGMISQILRGLARQETRVIAEVL